MKEVKMLLGESVFICEICGETSFSEKQTVCPGDSDNSRKKLSVPDVKVGDVVKLYMGDVFGTYSAKPGEWTVKGLGFKKGPGLFSQPWGVYKALSAPAHTLVITLLQNLENRAWREGDAGMSIILLTWEDFLLWRKNDYDELKRAGLLFS